MSDNDKVLHNVFGSGHDLYLDEYYYISYPDQLEAMSEEEMKERFKRYFHIASWPDSNLKFRAIAELAPEENPHYIKITGRMVMEWCERGYIPQFDQYFKQTRRLIMVPVEAWDFYTKYSKLLRRGQQRR